MYINENSIKPCLEANCKVNGSVKGGIKLLDET